MTTLSAHSGATYEAGGTGLPRGEHIEGVAVNVLLSFCVCVRMDRRTVFEYSNHAAIFFLLLWVAGTSKNAFSQCVLHPLRASEHGAGRRPWCAWTAPKTTQNAVFQNILNFSR